MWTCADAWVHGGLWWLGLDDWDRPLNGSSVEAVSKQCRSNEEQAKKPSISTMNDPKDRLDRQEDLDGLSCPYSVFLHQSIWMMILVLALVLLMTMQIHRHQAIWQ